MKQATLAERKGIVFLFTILTVYNVSAIQGTSVFTALVSTRSWQALNNKNKIKNENKNNNKSKSKSKGKGKSKSKSKSKNKNKNKNSSFLTLH